MRFKCLLPGFSRQNNSFFVFGLIGGLTCFVVACKQHTSSPQFITVDAASVAEKEFLKTIQAEGKLTNRSFILFRPQVSGLITKVLVDEGESVTKGQILVVLDHAQQKAELENAQAEFQEAEIQAKRWKLLAAEGGGSREEAEEKQVKAVGARSQLVAKQVALDKRYIRSPIDGIIGDLSGVNPGNFLQEGENTFVILNNQNLWVDLEVPATQANQIQLNQSVKLIDESSHDVIGRGSIDFIAPYFRTTEDLRPLNTLQVRAAFVNRKSNLRPNQLIRTEIIIGKKAFPAIPASSVLFQAQQPYVYQLIPLNTYLKGSDVSPKQRRQLKDMPASTLIAVEAPLVLGSLQSDHFPVRQGLNSGDRIAVSRSSMLSNGTPVRISAGAVK